MTKVFIAGSRKLSRLSPEVKARIDAMIEKGFAILVGDANGADQAVQRYLADKGYRNVVVHCMSGNCRNNVGGWPTQEQEFAVHKLERELGIEPLLRRLVTR